MDIMSLFKVVLMIQLFYSFSITTITYALPDDSLDFVTSFSDITSKVNLESVSGDVQDSLQRQTNIPVVELGALVFYSGNILIDLILNFLFAIPEMLAMLINGFTMLFNVDSYLFAIVQLFSSVIIGIMYLLGVIQLLTGIRSGRLIA